MESIYPNAIYSILKNTDNSDSGNYCFYDKKKRSYNISAYLKMSGEAA